ncbi:hypothetical protein CKO28_25650 [Rhodovibrio sodomensis]|uniref:DNA-binding protein n=1 Tax=Rhodovibrio sodomensis TaxID=1088 RepID=A0ABS1DPY3_9PROT|nr:hypothetical protein [Rhodovibrio sodomensis]MBK1671390.1 hypothetical protein [Rhodovibrio sodomensis]
MDTDTHTAERPAAVALPARPHVLYDIAAAANFVSEELGIATSYEKMRAYADRNRLPFVKSPLDGVRRVSELALYEVYIAPHREALSDWRKGKAPGGGKRRR